MSQYSDLVVADGAVALWVLDDNAASTTIVATVGSNGTLNGGDNTSTLSTAQAPAGIGGRSLHFNGSDDYISLGDSTDYEPNSHANMTWEAWIRIDSKKIQAVFYKHDEIFLNIGEGGATDQFYGKTGPASTYVGYQYKVDNTTRSVDTWYHFVGVYSSGTLDLYINGTLDSTSYYSGTTTPSATSNILRIGSEVSNRWFDGYISHAAIYHTALSSGTITKHYEVGAGISTYPSVSNVPSVTFTPYVPAVATTGSVTLNIDNTPSVTVSTFAPTVTVGITIAPALVTVTYTPYAPTVKAYTGFSSTSFDGTIQDWVISGPSNTSPAYGNADRYGVTGATSSNTVTIRCYDDATIPSDAYNIQMTVYWSYENTSGTTAHGLYNYVTGSTPVSETYSESSPSGVVNKVSAFGSLNYNNVYYFKPFLTSSGGFTQVDTLVLSWEALVSTVTISPTCPVISFAASAPSVSTGINTSLSVSNTPTITITGMSVTLQVNGGITVGAPSSTVTLTAYVPTLSLERNVAEDVTNVSSISLSMLVPARIDPDDQALTFRFVDKSSTARTSGETTALSTLDLGSALFNQEKIFGFRLANTSSSACDFEVSASSTNNLGSMITFSTTKAGTYSSSLNILGVKANKVTDVIWGKLTVGTTAYIDNGSFLIHVEQTNA